MEKKTLFLPIHQFFAKHQSILNDLSKHFALIIPKNDRFKFEDNRNIEYVEDIIGPVDRNDIEEQYLREMNDFISYTKNTLKDLIPCDMDQKNLKDYINACYPALYSGYLRAWQFNRLTEKRTVDMVFVSADYTGISRPIVIEARKKGIPTVAISHGNYCAKFDPDAYVSEIFTGTSSVSDYLILDNNLETAIISRHLEKRGLAPRSTPLALGSPLDDVKADPLEKTASCRMLKLDPGRYTIALMGSWGEFRTLAQTFQFQFEETSFYETAFRELRDFVQSNKVQIIVKLHPAIAAFGEEESVRRYIQRLAGQFFDEPVFVSTGFKDEVLGASDIVISFGLSSVIWEAVLQEKPAAVILSSANLRSLEPSRIREGSELCRNGLVEFILHDHDLRQFSEKYLEIAERDAFVRRKNAFLDKWRIKDIPVGEKCRNICKWIGSVLGSNIESDDQGPVVSIIIPLFNKVEWTRKCLDALSQNTPDGLYELILIDNGSTDETNTFLQTLAKDNIKIITNEKNLGFARSCNQGAQAASTRYLLFLNNDTEPQKGWLKTLLAIIENDDSVAAVGSKLLYPDMTIQHAGVVIVNDQAGHDPLQARNNYVNKPATLPGANQPTLYQALTAACVLIDNKAFLKVGGFDEEYWNGYEDVDLCFKLQEQGGKLVYQPASVVIHHESKSGPERFVKARDNIALLHKKWIGKIKPDVILNEDGTFSPTDAGKIQLYHAPITMKQSLTPALMPVTSSLISIVILTFNQLEYTKKCVKSLRKHTSEAHEIIFVDNGSTDGTVKWLKTQVKENKNYRLIENKQNLGFAKGCNQGIGDSRGEFILLLNNDVVVAEGWLSGLIDCLSHAPDAGIVGPMTNNISGPQQINDDSYRSVDYLDKFAAKFQKRYRHRRMPLRRIVGFCMLFKRALVEQIGMLDESFGTGNFEDDDLCLRAVLAGYRNYIAGDVFIHHYGSRSFIGNKINYGASISDNRRIIDKKWTLSTASPGGKKLAVLRATELADDFYAKGKIDQAVETLVDCIKLTPDAQQIYYELARIFLESRQFAEARDVVASMPEAAKNNLKGMAYAGYAKEGLGLDDEAAAYADSMLALNENYPAALNLKGVLAFKKEDKKEAESYFQKAIDADPGYGEAHTNLGVLYWGMDKKDDALFHLKKAFRLSPTIPDVHSIYYSVISSLGIFNDAETDFQEALKSHPNNRNLHFLYIDILIRGNKFDSAIMKIEDALALFGPDPESLNAALAVREKIGPLQIENSSAKGTLSLCMIVKNEEKNLIRCLKSVRDIVDEMIIVDTGSTDKTRDIATVFGAKVFDFPWTGDFSEARNQSLAHATGDWILVLDADEVISPRDFDELKNLTHKRTSSPIAYAIATRNYMNNTSVIGWTPKEGKYPEEAGAGWTTSTKVRLLPRRKDVFFSNPVHELLEDSLKRANIPIRQCKIIVHHYGKLDRVREAQKDEDYYLLGKIKYESDPANLKFIYELAKQAHLLKKYDEAVELWLRLLSLIKTDHASASYQEIAKISYDDPLPEIYIQLASSYLLLDRFEEALHTSLKAMESRVKRKEYVVIYAHCEVMAGSLEKASLVLEELAKTTSDYPPAMLLTAVIFCLQDKKEQARTLFQLLKQKKVRITPNLNKFAKQFYSYGKKDEALRILRAIMENQLNDADSSTMLEEFQKAEVK